VTRALLLFTTLLASSDAFARAASDLPFSVGDAYSAAVRFVRVDRACVVTDKDPDAAFLTFECKDDDKVKHGALEIFKTRVEGRDGVRLQVALGDDPHYVELRFLELLERKLREERGNPPPLVSTPAKKPPPSDAGTN